MSNFLNKHLNRNKCLKVIALGTDRVIRTHYVIPDNNIFNLYKGKDNAQAFTYKPSQVYKQKRFSTVYVVEGEAEVVDMFTHKATISAGEFGVVMENKVMKDFVKANTKDNPSLVILLLFATLGVLAIVIYLLYTMQGDIGKILPNDTTTQFINTIFRR